MMGFSPRPHPPAFAHIGLSITLKAVVKLPGWWWGAIAQCMVRASAAKTGDPEFDPWWLPLIFSLPAGLLMLMGWRICGAFSTVLLLSTQT